MQDFNIMILSQGIDCLWKQITSGGSAKDGFTFLSKSLKILNIQFYYLIYYMNWYYLFFYRLWAGVKQFVMWCTIARSRDVLFPNHVMYYYPFKVLLRHKVIQESSWCVKNGLTIGLKYDIIWSNERLYLRIRSL